MRSEIEASFRALHPELLDDPLAELPDNLRRFLAGLDSLEQLFGSEEVSARFGVTKKSARDWLESWQLAGVIEPSVPGAKRVHRYRVSASWVERLGD